MASKLEQEVEVMIAEIKKDGRLRDWLNMKEEDIKGPKEFDLKIVKVCWKEIQKRYGEW